jgi:glycoside/pentoside/hexuronide:cation symporter, GPH family
LAALRFFVSLAPVAILLVSFLVVRRYPITRQKHHEILAELERRKLAAQNLL